MSGQTHFYVAKNGEQQGPFGLVEIVNKVKANELALTDYLYDEVKADWVMLIEYAALADQLKNIKPSAPPPKAGGQATPQSPTSASSGTSAQVQAGGDSTSGPEVNAEASDANAEWYVLKGENKFGPFAYTDVVKMLQQRVVFEFDFAWRPGMDTWMRVADLDPFSNESIQKLKQTLMPEIQEVFFRRRHRRVNFNSTILIHDNHSVWKGQGVEISSGGAGLVMENSEVTPGQVLYLHFKPGDGVPPFNAICEVVSKKHVEGVKDKKAPVMYGVRFTNLNPSTQKFITEYSKRSDAA